MTTLNEINRRARLHAEQETAKLAARQAAEFRSAMIAGAIYTAIAAALIISVGCVYHGGIGWLL